MSDVPLSGLQTVAADEIDAGDIVCDTLTVRKDVIVAGNQTFSGDTRTKGQDRVGSLIVDTNASVAGSLSASLVAAGSYLLKGQPLGTKDISENGPLYFTEGRARAAITARGPLTYDVSLGQIGWGGSTSDVPEGSRLYYTSQRATTDARLAIGANAPLSYSSTTGNVSWNGTTDDVSEGAANKYYSDARARSSISATVVDATEGSYNSSTGVISLPRNYWSLNTSNKTANTRNLVITNPIEIGLEDQGRWLYRGYGTNGIYQYGIGQWTNGRVRTFTPSYGSSGYANYDSSTQALTDVFKIDYTGDGFLYGSAALTLKNTGTNGAILKLWDVNEAGYNLWQDRTNDRFKVSKKSGGTILDILALSSSGELGLGQGIAPKAGYSVYAEKPLSIKVGNGDCVFLEGTDMFNGNPATVNFKSGAASGYLQMVDTTGGQFIMSKPLTVGGKIYTSGALEIEGVTTLRGTANMIGGVTMNSTSTHSGKATFTGGIDTNQGIKLTVGDPNKMLYVDYGALNDKYGFGQYVFGKNRIFSSTSGNAFWSSNNLSYILNDSLNYFIDTLRTQNGKTCILSYQDMSPTEAFEATGVYAIKEPQISTAENDAALKVVLQRSLDADNDNTRTFYTISQNVGISTNKRQSSLWINGVQCLNNYGNNNPTYFENIFSSQIHPDFYIDSNINNVANRPQLCISQYMQGYGGRTAMRLFFQPSSLGGVGGNNYSNVMFPQLARGAYWNCFVSPDGHIYPDVYASDQRLKKNIVKQDKPILDEFRHINVVNFNWDYDGEHKDFCHQQPRTTTDETQIGVIAQNLEEQPTIREHYKIVDVYKFSPELPTGNNKNPLSDSHFKPTKDFFILNKERIPFLNMKAIQETNDRIDDIEQRVSNLGSAEVEGLRARVDALEAENARLRADLVSLMTELKRKYVI